MINQPVKSRALAYLAHTRKMLIDGAWVASERGKTFDARNPATGEVLGSAYLAEAIDVDRAVKAARHAFETSWALNVWSCRESDIF